MHPTSHRSSRRHPVRLAAALVSGALALGACTADGPVEDVAASPDPDTSGDASVADADADAGPGDGTDDGVDGPEPTPSLPESALVDPPVEGFADAARVELEVPGEAFLRRLSPDGTHLLASAPDDAGVACEDSAPSSLQLRPAEGGTFTRVLPEGSPDGALLDAGDGRALVVSGCEGFLSTVVLAEVLQDGSLRVLEELSLPDGGTEGIVTAVAPVPGEDGTPGGIVAAREGADGPELVIAGLDGSEQGDPTPLPGETYQLWATTTGVYAASFDDQESAEVLADVTGDVRLVGFSAADVADDGTLLVVAGDAGVSVVDADGAVESWVEDPLGDEVEWGSPVMVAPDRALVVRDRLGAAELVVVGPDGVLATIDEGVAELPRPSVSSDGTRLLYATVDPDTFASTYVLRVQR